MVACAEFYLPPSPLWDPHNNNCGMLSVQRVFGAQSLQILYVSNGNQLQVDIFQDFLNEIEEYSVYSSKSVDNFPELFLTFNLVVFQAQPVRRAVGSPYFIGDATVTTNITSAGHYRSWILPQLTLKDSRGSLYASRYCIH